MLRKVVDGMSAAKLNKLHWHLADDQAFPLVLPSLPNLSKLGAFSPAERYSPWEVAAFILHYQRLTEHALKTLPDRADFLWELATDRAVERMWLTEVAA